MYKEKLQQLKKEQETIEKLKKNSSNTELEDDYNKLAVEIKKIKKEIEKIEDIKEKISNQNSLLKEKIKNNVISSFDIKNKQFLYVSLNGVSNLEEVAHMIFSQIYVHISGIMDSKATKIIEKALSACSFGLGNVISFNIDLERIFGDFDYSTYIKNNAIKKYVIIFDDFERCKIEISELLGFINRFIEEKNIKVIIVGNEEEIENSIYNADRQTQILGATLIACSNLNNCSDINVEEKTNDFSETNEEDEENDRDVHNPIINHIQRNIEMISSNCSIYSIIKEKFICQTYYFSTNYDYVIAKMTKGIKTRIGGISRRLSRFVKELKITNMRILSSAIEKIDFLYRKDNIINNISNMVLENVEFCIVLSSYSLSFLSKYNLAKEAYNYFFSTSELYDIQNHDEKFNFLIKIYKKARYELTDYYCIEEVFDFVYHYNNFDSLLVEMNELSSRDPKFKRLFDNWESTFKSEKELTNCFIKVFKKYDEYDLLDMIKIYYKYGEYVYKYKIPEIKEYSLLIIYNKLCNKISNINYSENNNIEIKENNIYLNMPVTELKDNFKNIKKLINNSKCKNVIGHMIEELKENNSKMNFDKYLEITTLGGGFFSLFDIEAFKNEFSNLTINQVNKFYYLCNYIYDENSPMFYYRNDVDNLHTFIDYLNDEFLNKNDDLLMKKVIGEIKMFLSNILKHIEEQLG